jgi:hypothetical protein
VRRQEGLRVGHNVDTRYSPVLLLEVLLDAFGRSAPSREPVERNSIVLHLRGGETPKSECARLGGEGIHGTMGFLDGGVGREGRKGAARLKRPDGSVTRAPATETC